MSEPSTKKAKTEESQTADCENKKFLIGTRKSNLAMWQANHVNDCMNKNFPSSFEVVGISTLGDKDQMKPLNEFAQKGVFTKELDVALLGKKIDLAVHCIKDLPTVLPDGLVVGCILERGDVEDCVIFHEKHKEKELGDLPKGSIIGTSAMRRTALIQNKHPHLVCKNIRGNVNTRLAKLDKGDYDAIILAAVGLKRLKMEDRIHQMLSKDVFGYAVGQGALAVVIREGDVEMEKKLTTLVCKDATLQCHAERKLLNVLNGGCKVPIAVRCAMSDSKEENKEDDKEEKNLDGKKEMSLWGAVSSPSGDTMVEESSSILLCGSDEERIQLAIQLGNEVGEALLEKGAAKILEGIV